MCTCLKRKKKTTHLWSKGHLNWQKTEGFTRERAVDCWIVCYSVHMTDDVNVVDFVDAFFFLSLLLLWLSLLLSLWFVNRIFRYRSFAVSILWLSTGSCSQASKLSMTKSIIVQIPTIHFEVLCRISSGISFDTHFIPINNFCIECFALCVCFCMVHTNENC